MKTLVTILLAVAAVTAGAQQRYDPQLAKEREAILESLYMTRECVFNAAQAMGRVSPDERVIRAFIRQSCGGRMKAQLMHAGYTEKEALEMTSAVMEKATDDALRWGR